MAKCRYIPTANIPIAITFVPYWDWDREWIVTNICLGEHHSANVSLAEAGVDVDLRWVKYMNTDKAMRPLWSWLSDADSTLCILVWSCRAVLWVVEVHM